MRWEGPLATHAAGAIPGLSSTPGDCCRAAPRRSPLRPPSRSCGADPPHRGNRHLSGLVRERQPADPASLRALTLPSIRSTGSTFDAIVLAKQSAETGSEEIMALKPDFHEQVNFNLLNGQAFS